jgi:ElaB/YqjD/DUF883 family membrane-anchored ribosome-binding protein
MSQATAPTELANSTTDRLASMAHETLDRVTTKANRAENEVRGAAIKAAESAKLLQEQAAAAAEDNLRKLRSYVTSNPLITAGLAFAAGALASVLIRRQ